PRRRADGRHEKILPDEEPGKRPADAAHRVEAADRDDDERDRNGSNTCGSRREKPRTRRRHSLGTDARGAGCHRLRHTTLPCATAKRHEMRRGCLGYGVGGGVTATSVLTQRTTLSDDAHFMWRVNVSSPIVIASTSPLASSSAGW